MENNKSIVFFSEKNTFGELSNFFPLRKQISFQGKLYHTSEHLYQDKDSLFSARKFIHEKSKPIDLEYVDVIRKANTSYIAKLLASQRETSGQSWMEKVNATIKQYKSLGAKMRTDWDNVKDDIMKDVLRIKFSSDKHCLEVLMNTGDSSLIEGSPYDGYWGWGKDKRGKNMLGKLLMEIRNENILF